MLLALIFPKGQILYYFFFVFLWSQICEMMQCQQYQKVWRGRQQVGGSEWSEGGWKYWKTPQSFGCVDWACRFSHHYHANLHHLCMRSLSVCLYPSVFLSIHPSVHKSAQTWQFTPKVTCKPALLPLMARRCLWLRLNGSVCQNVCVLMCVCARAHVLYTVSLHSLRWRNGSGRAIARHYNGR